MTLILQDPNAVLTVRPVFWKRTCSEIFVKIYRLNVYVVKIKFLNKIEGFPYTLGAEETNIHICNDFLEQN